MISFTVHEPPEQAADKFERAEQVVMVRDGFSFWAAIATPFWMIAHRLWLPLAAYVGLLVALELVALAVGFELEAVGWIMLAVHVLVGFENDAIRRYDLKRRGYSEIGSVSGRTVEVCERRFFDDWLQGQPFLSRDALTGGGAREAHGMGRRLSAATLWPGRSR